MRFHFRLQERDGSEYRQGTIHSPSLDEARAALHRSEAKRAGFRLTAGELAAFGERLERLAIDAKHKFATAAETVTDKARDLIAAGIDVPRDIRHRLALHNQAEPYEIKHLGSAPPERSAKRKPKAKA